MPVIYHPWVDCSDWSNEPKFSESECNSPVDVTDKPYRVDVDCSDDIVGENSLGFGSFIDTHPFFATDPEKHQGLVYTVYPNNTSNAVFVNQVVSDWIEKNVSADDWWFSWDDCSTAEFRFVNQNDANAFCQRFGL